MRIEIPENNSGVIHIELDEAGNLKIIYKDGHVPKLITDTFPSPFGACHLTMDPFTFPPHKQGGEKLIISKEPCDCDTCRKERGELFRDRMYVCHVCGNKRCPKIENHRFKCTGSNDLNQIGELEDV